MNDYSECKFLSARGFIELCDYKSKEILYTMDVKTSTGLHHFLNFKNKNYKFIHIQGAYIYMFYKKILKHISYPFVLISSEGDVESNEYMFPNRYDFYDFLSNKYLLHWFTQNCYVKHKKITLIPLGVDYYNYTISKPLNPRLMPLEQELMMKEVIKNSVPFWERNVKCYGNFHFNINTRFGKYDRVMALNEIPGDIIDYEKERISRKNTWEKQSKYAYIISPLGNVHDCYRTWESLLLGNIVVVRTSYLDVLYRDLPVLIIRKWSDLTQTMLNNGIEFFKRKYNNGEIDYNQLKMDYWKNIIITKYNTEINKKIK